MKSSQSEIEERTRLAGTNKFELLLFRLGEAPQSGQRELFGINVFKVREVLVMPPVTELANAHEHMMGVANIRGQLIPVINLPAVVGCKPSKGLGILMVTEFGRTVQAFAVEDVREIVRLDWDQVLPAEGSHAGALITSLARLDGAKSDSRLAQVLDVEQILRNVMPEAEKQEINKEAVGPALQLPPGTIILAADDSAVARSVIELGLQAMGAKYEMVKSGKEAWERLVAIHNEAQAQGQTARDRIAVVLSDLEMPEMDGFTLTRLIKQDSRFKNVPVVIHSSLTGTTNENHVKTVGADAYVAKFVPRELADTIRRVLPATRH
ncbi:chemotaxis protein [Curvibacter sp. APW13]|uniref:chemotaxis protein CheV n=1 Tax=Curvibacter sp. APW13 TaxID=3077236 RepID=UPI0028E05EEE|nr:chemotaxis protein [Curvibacter sp. APW13]MDT8990099.1 chemotaxis protein [Curvibacter sp. APW13]